jgi:hypothetical protein
MTVGVEVGKLKTAMAVRRAHRNLHALVAQPGDAACPFSFDRRAPLKLETELLEKLYCLIEILDDDSDVVHPLESHVSSLVKYLDQLKIVILSSCPLLLPICRLMRWSAAVTPLRRRMEAAVYKEDHRHADTFGRHRPWQDDLSPCCAGNVWQGAGEEEV